MRFSGIQAAALRALQPAAVLSSSLCQRCIPLVEAALAGRQGHTDFTLAAIDFLAAAISTFPTMFGSRVNIIVSVMAEAGDGNGATPAGASPPPEQHSRRTAAHAAASFSKLLLSNKLKVPDLMGSTGVALASPVPEVSTIALDALRRLFASCQAADRAALLMGVVHQTPEPLRRGATTAALQLLNEGDERCDALASSALTLAMAAKREEDATIAAALLEQLHPSAKTLRSMQSMLSSFGSSGAALRESVRQALCKFVQRAVTKEVQPGGDNSAEQGAGPSIGQKRARQGKFGGNGAAALRHELLRVLEVSKRNKHLV